MRSYIAEFLGTGVLTLVVGLSLAGEFPLSTPVLAALTLGLGVYTMGHISGAHFNPAVTMALMTLKKITGKDAVGYLFAQYAGAWSASHILKAFVTPAQPTLSTSGFVGLAEAVGMAVFAFGIAAVVKGRVPSSLSGVVVGGSLLLGVAIAALAGSNGVLNPAVAMGIGSYTLMYLFGPIFGAVLGMQTYFYLDQKR